MSQSLRVVLVLTGLSAIGVIFTGNPIFSSLLIMWAIFLAVNWIWARTLKTGLKLERISSGRRSQVSQIYTEEFKIRNGSWLPLVWAELVDDSGIPGSRASRIITNIRGNRTQSFLTRTRLTRRGVYSLGPTSIITGDLFGLFTIELSEESKGTLLVYPSMVNVGSFPKSAGVLPGGEALRQKTHQITTNAAGIREYYPGDSLNRIHWLSTARRNKLMVKDYELDPRADIWILLDCEKKLHLTKTIEDEQQIPELIWQAAPHIELPPTTEEYQISIAVSLARHYLVRGRAVGIMASNQGFLELPADRGARQVGKVQETLAKLRADGDLPISTLVESRTKHLPRGSLVFILSVNVSDQLQKSAGYLVRLGLKPVVIIFDPLSFSGTQSSVSAETSLQGMGVPYRVIHCGDVLSKAISYPTGELDHPTFGYRPVAVNYPKYAR